MRSAIRLAFAISMALNPNILVIDELFAAGDAAFIKKAEKRMIRNSSVRLVC